MQITFDTTTITDDEVRGIFALLDTVRPAAFDPGPFDTEAVTRKVEEKLADKGWVAGPSDTVATFTDAHHPEAPPVPVGVDSNGLVWDERIHASSKALNADGTWRTKRGVDKALVEQVEAELRGAQIETYVELPEDVTPGHVGEAFAGITAPPAPPAPEAPKAPLAPTPTPAPTVDTNSTAVLVAGSSVSTPAAATGSATSPFVALMKRVTTAQGAGKLTQPRVKELLESLDKKSIMDLRTDEDALASFAVLLDGEGV